MQVKPTPGTGTFHPGERHARLRLYRSEGIGPQTFWALVNRFGSAIKALDAWPFERLRNACLASTDTIDCELDAAHRLGAHILFAGEENFPALLSVTAPVPPLIMVRGRLELLRMPAVAIVGARNASALGQRFAQGLSADLGGFGLVVVSGLARGIDTAAHRGALATGTIAVMAGGVDHVYPPENQALYEAILAKGAIISEMPPGFAPQARHFPRRNFFVAGLARGVVVVEASLNSGSLITARLALEQGREIFAVPGSPLDARARGANGLLRDGATLTESADDVINVLRPLLTVPPSPRALHEEDTRLQFAPFQDDGARVTAFANTLKPVEGLAAALLEQLGPVPIEIDVLSRVLGLSATQITSALMDMEIQGLVLRHPGQRVSRN